MPAPELPADVVAFVDEQIDSVPHLEALLLMWEQPAKSWSEHEIASRVYVDETAGGVILQDLVRRNLAAPSTDAEAAYRYDSAWDPTGTRMAAVARTYRQHLIRIASLIHSKASPAVREFARAFQLKPDRK
jgi:hypothetical protein